MVTSETARRHLPFRNVSVEVCVSTAATKPCTAVFGGCIKVTDTEIPMSAVAMLDSRLAQSSEGCRVRGGVRAES